MKTTVFLAESKQRVLQCNVSPDELRYCDELVSAITLAEKVLAEQKIELVQEQRRAAALALIHVMHGVLLHRLDRWLLTDESSCCDHVTGPERSKRVLDRYRSRMRGGRARQDSRSVPSLLDMVHWFVHDSRIQPESVAKAILSGLKLQDDPLVLAKLLQAGVLRNHLAHLSDYEKTHQPVALESLLASWIRRVGCRVELLDGALEELRLLALRLLHAPVDELKPRVSDARLDVTSAVQGANNIYVPTLPVERSGHAAVRETSVFGEGERRAGSAVVQETWSSAIHSLLIAGSIVVSIALVVSMASMLIKPPRDRSSVAASPSIRAQPLDSPAPSQPAVAMGPAAVLEPETLPPPNLDASVRAFLQRWIHEAWRQDIRRSALQDLYHEQVTVMFIARNDALPRESLPDRWRAMERERARPIFSTPNAESIQWEPPSAHRSSTVARACPQGPLVRVALRASTDRYNCGRGVRVPAVNQEYLVRLTPRPDGAMVVCYEAWSASTDQVLCAAYR